MDVTCGELLVGEVPDGKLSMTLSNTLPETPRSSNVCTRSSCPEERGGFGVSRSVFWGFEGWAAGGVECANILVSLDWGNEGGTGAAFGLLEGPALV